MVRTRLRDEEGLAASALLVTALIVGLGIFVYVAVPYVTAVDAKAKNRTAADAAAIAGAEGVREDLLSSLGDDGIPGSWTDLPGAAGLGRSAAEEYASLNDATLVSYWFDAADGTAHTEVEGRGVDGSPSRSRAVAQVDLPQCEALDIPEPPAPPAPPAPSATAGPGPADGPPPTPSPPPLPDPTDVSVDCGPIDLTFQIRYTEDGVEVHFPPGQLDKIRDVMDVRLVD
ncbi:hypothetical protein [Nocardioides mesophilus]|uniref:Uncharacterized protein n=1 Tax=Nocardioides mesophilus TaxID=433659 RepID=A0A7G9REY7_9ACTN|nr:hypothetical protein [Nocardioides mesophilus]QNN54162.1 hypothetical protein H9L09_07305 [Nocardioides mesophilus]